MTPVTPKRPSGTTPQDADGVLELQVHLDAPLPEELVAGAPTAVFVCGWCFARAGAIRELTVVVDGEPQPVAAHGMPRLDVVRALHPSLDVFALGGALEDPASAEDPRLLSYRSGFWGLVRLTPRVGDAPRELVLRAVLEDGTVLEEPLGTLAVVAPPEPVVVAAPAPSEGPLVAVCLATYEPNMALLRRQVASLRTQTHTNWVCLVSDDCSTPARYAEIAALLGDDPRFVLTRAPRRLGFYHNFERALALVGPGVDHVALADQDDAWYPEKLAELLAGLGGAELVYSDARIVDTEGRVLAETYWERRANNHTDLLSLLVANAVTGAASLFPRALLDDVLPFPPAQFAHFHDHWIGLVALSRGDIAFIDRPLYDYVQHGDASLGHAAATRMTTLRQRVGGLRRDPRERVRMWRMHYFVDIARLQQFASVLQDRVGPRMDPAKRRVLERFLRTDRSLVALGRLWLRGARELVGKPETLGAEWALAYGFSWRRALAATARDRPTRGLRLDAVPPTNLAPRPGHHAVRLPAVRMVGEKVAPLELALRDDAPARVNLLVPTIDLEHFFGGYIAKFNLARKLAERGVRVRIVTVDPVGPLPAGWRRQLEAYEGLAGMFERVEVAFGREGQGLEVSRDDRFIATTWWSAHIAAAATRELEGPPFLYLVQEHEPFTFPRGTLAALADESYRLPHVALFSTELLRGWFREHGVGVYAEGAEAGDRRSVAFENAITRVPAVHAEELAARDVHRLLFYARPEPHAARNMFELGVLGLERAVAQGAFRGWELHGIGSLGAATTVELAPGTTLKLLPRSGQGAYADVLRAHDVGLALMDTPHPSLVPIEMASAGMVTVTTTFANKTPAALRAISPNIVAVEASIARVADALAGAAAAVGDVEARVAGSRVAWSDDWDRSFDGPLLDRLLGLLDP